MKVPVKLEERLIIALDDPAAAPRLVGLLAPLGVVFKISLAVYVALDQGFISLIHAAGGKVMLDFKLHDIPMQVGASTASIVANIAPWAMTVHATGGVAMMTEAVKNKGDSLVLGVTVLTSMDETSCQDTYHADVKTTVFRFAKRVLSAGGDGIVCSAQELMFLKLHPEFDDLAKVCPGIRLPGNPPDDQRRTMSPDEAIRSGATHLVVGRPITGASDPKSAVATILEDMIFALL